MERRKCSTCGCELPKDAVFCTSCGSNKIIEEQKNIFCSKCGKELKLGSSFCGECGAKVEPKKTEEQLVVAPLENQWNGTDKNIVANDKKSVQRMIIIAIGVAVIALLLVGVLAWSSSNNSGEVASDDGQEVVIEETESEETTVVTEAETEEETEDEFEESVITLSDNVTESLMTLIEYYVASSSSYNGTLEQSEALICDSFFSYSFAYLDEIQSGFAMQYMNGAIIYNSSLGHTVYVVEEDAVIAYLEDSINMSNVSTMGYDSYVEVAQNIDAEIELAQEQGMLYPIGSEWGDKGVYNIEFTEIKQISQDTILITGTLDEFAGESVYHHSYELVFRENEDSLWAGYTLMGIQYWNGELSSTQEAEEEELSENVSLITGTDLTSEYLTDSQLRSLSADELRILRNEIYARHGYTFMDESLAAYFEDQTWYEATTDFVDESEFNQCELANIELIMSYEE